MAFYKRRSNAAGTLGSQTPPSPSPPLPPPPIRLLRFFPPERIFYSYDIFKERALVPETGKKGGMKNRLIYLERERERKRQD